MAWDRGSPKRQAAAQERALKMQLVDAVGPFSPFWRDRFTALGCTEAQVATVAALSTVPAVGERDVCPDGDPFGAAALVLQAGEAEWALHTDGPALRRALVGRLVRPGSYRAVVEADTRPTSFVFAGLGMRFPIASTRGDLDVVVRAGARLWTVLGLTRSDVMIAATVLALRSATTVDDLDEAGARLTTVTTVLLVGAPTSAERAAVAEALERVGLQPVVLAVHAPDGHRLLWGECRGGEGLHTYPDLELVQLVDPETGEAGDGQGPDEVVLSQLGMRGSALLRWRTADLADAINTATCPGCQRTVPRALGLHRRALVPELSLRSGIRGVDLRAVCAALVGRGDVADWRVVVGPSERRSTVGVVVHVVARSDVDPSDVAVGVALDVRVAAGLLPTQVVVEDAGSLPDEDRLSRRLHCRL